MSNTTKTTARTRVPMDSTRKTALVAGIFYLITFVSIPTLVPPLALYSLVTGKDYLISSGSDTGALWGAFLEIIVALAGIGTARLGRPSPAFVMRAYMALKAAWSSARCAAESCRCRSERIVARVRTLCWLRMRKSGWCLEVERLVRSRVGAVGLSLARSVIGRGGGEAGC